MSASIDTILTAETPEGIAIVMRPAGFAVRCTAFLIDVLIRYLILSAVGTTLAVAGHFATGAMFIALFIVNWLYPVIFELMPMAATPGKQVMGLQVMMANGLPLTPAGCLTRNLMRAVDMLPLLYAFAIVTMLLRNDARRLGDLAGGTLVVYRRDQAAAGGFARGNPMPPPVVLSLRQQAAIAAFASRVDRLTVERAEEVAALAGAAAPLRNSNLSMTARLVGIARWLHGQRRGSLST